MVAGSSIYAITKEWNRLGLLTARYCRWRGTQVRQVLLAPRNAGLRVLRGRVIGTGNWPAIVPEDIWRGVVDILADPKRRNRRSRAPPNSPNPNNATTSTRYVSKARALKTRLDDPFPRRPVK